MTTVENRYLQYIQQENKDKAGWLEPALTAAGAIAGSFLMPGVGTKAGAMLGAGMGQQVGSVAHDLANGEADPMKIAQAGMGVASGWNAGQVPQTSIMPNPGMNPPMPYPDFQPWGFANGGPVPGGQMPWWVRAGATQADPQAVLEQFGGPQVPEFKPQQPSHPTLEMLATIIPQVLASMPKPVKPNNRAIGTWLPAIGTAIGAPAAYAQGQREKANATGQAQYDALVEARNKRMAAAAPQVAAAMFRDPRTAGRGPQDALHTEMDPNVLAGLGAPGWVRTYGDYDRWKSSTKPVGTSATQDVPLTGDALLMEANKYLATGDITSFGRDQKNRVRILNVAASLRRGETPDVALARVEYGADRKSFSEMRVNLDAVTAFEKTVLKNADVFIRAMQSIPDTGVPALNTPLRLMSDRGLGSPELAAFNAARRTIIPEFARILSNPRLVGQLTDQSRREVEEIIAGNATLNQALQTIQVLKQDAANRREAYQSQLGEIRGRLRDRNSVSTQGQTSQGEGGFQWPQSSLAPTGGK